MTKAPPEWQSKRRPEKLQLGTWALLVSLVFMAGCISGVVDPEAHRDSATVPAAEDEDAASQEVSEQVPEEVPAQGDSAPAVESFAQVEALYEAGDYNAALLALIGISRGFPLHPDVEPMRQDILAAMSEARAVKSFVDADIAEARMAIEATEQAAIPDTYRLEQVVDMKLEPHSPPPSELKKALAIHVSMHLKGATLSSFFDAISKSANLNVISDKGLGQGKSVDIEVDDVPLQAAAPYAAGILAPEGLVEAEAR